MRPLLFALLLATSPVFAEPKVVIQPTIEQVETSLEPHRVRLWNAASADLRAKLDAPTKDLIARIDAKRKPNETEPDPALEARKAVSKVSLGQIDIDALVQMVMMQAAKSTSDDLKELLKQMKEQNEAKSEMREEQQRKLQLLQDRRAKLYKALSNMMKKISDTQSAVVSNMK